ncbi:MAG: hypothetical protein A3J83_07360 [Elusimicrobia bacterium RIFOXYA2_FULL_40_6]|nr:MAG: hypothetical protein A3J83_07360 [Elusimicrobia bacterium RIFOXYA2_FULL_40_6]
MGTNKIVTIDEAACTGCGVCVSMCPKKILYINKKNKKCMVTDETKCDRLAGCERMCPAGAIKIGPLIDFKNLYSNIMNKLSFRRQSDGN